MWVVPSTIPYSNTFHGEIFAQPLSTNIQPYVATEPSLVAAQHDELSVYDIAKTPSLLDYMVFTVAGTFGTLVSTWPVNPMQFFQLVGTQRFGSHLGYAASFFTMWTGDICYKIVIPSTKFQQFRVAVVWSPQPITTYSEDLRQERYDILGTTTIDFLVPWTSQYPYKAMRVPNVGDTNLNMSNGFIGVFMLTSIVNNTSATASPCTAMIFSSGGQSLRFARYRSAVLSGITGNPQQAASMLAQGAFGATTLGVMSNIVDEDNVVSLREIAKRRVYVNGWTSPSLVTIPLYDPVNSSNNLSYILRKFKYWRGSVISSILAQSQTMQYLVSREQGSAWELAQLRVTTTTQPEVEVVLPFLSEEGAYATGAMQFTFTSPSPSITLHGVGSVVGVVDVFAALSDDFSAGLIQPSPIISGNYTY